MKFQVMPNAYLLTNFPLLFPGLKVVLAKRQSSPYVLGLNLLGKTFFVRVENFKFSTKYYNNWLSTF